MKQYYYCSKLLKLCLVASLSGIIQVNAYGEDKHLLAKSDITGGFYSNHTVPAPKSGKYAKLGATKGVTKQGYAMIGSDPSVQKWDLTNVTSSGTVLRMDVNHNGFKKTQVRFEFSTPSGAFGYSAKIDGPDGWYDLQIPLSEFKNNSGAVADAKKLGEIKFFLQGYSTDNPMEINFDNLRLSAK